MSGEHPAFASESNGELVGNRFGKLVLLERYVDSDKRRTRYLCRCDCGIKKLVRIDSLKSGATTSCGCYHKKCISTHRLTGSRLYKIWDGMKQRCYNQKCASYRDYGERGIVVCTEWRNSFECFRDWALVNGYADHLTIERKDNNGNYEPGNCRWATKQEQNRNKRNTFTHSQVVSIRNDSRIHRVIADDFGVNQSTVTRIKNGLRWSPSNDQPELAVFPSAKTPANPTSIIPSKDPVKMAIIHDTIKLAAGSTYPSLGVLFGSRVSTEVFSAINDLGHQSFFGSEFDQRRDEFFMRYVKPMDQVNFDIGRTVNALMNPDQFRILESIDDFRSTPACMEMAIALFAPVRQGIEEGRFEGFGYDPETLPSEDVYGRLIDNFTCENVGDAMDADGYYQTSGTMYSDDPDLDDDQLHAIRRTREYILNKILKETERDPTAIDLTRG